MCSSRHLSGVCRLDTVNDSYRYNRRGLQVGQILTQSINKTLIYCDIPLIIGLGDSVIGSRTGHAQSSPISPPRIMRLVQKHVRAVGKCLSWISIVAVCLNINRTLKKEDSQFHHGDDVKVAEKIEDTMAPSWRVNKIRHFLLHRLLFKWNNLEKLVRVIFAYIKQQ